MNEQSYEIIRNDDRSRYEVSDGARVLGFAMFREEPGRVVFTHTVVKPEFEGRGIGSELARHVIEATIAAGDTIVPECPFIAAYLEEHPEYADSVAAPTR
ncbi:GNAT family N-acetyltransferase [Agromyces aerolatus]|uniref:GNAT family N-acetyltransferase n=1 Tax=Agromyces sp. LY-1074 TaxID=3074080 RepID=UPI002864CFD8|nr:MULTISPECIES: GNAT family N-acetyltransferase [unclassified Agromyces]MDR5701926.1 GNAT family N-acetyltransferase [Agromyces sp. LY-1074]MDR5708150.1 GNAT family N-acetyltransferase [Agromyces sp. LY-1358]